MNPEILVVAAFFTIIVSIQFTLNKILIELRSLKKSLRTAQQFYEDQR